MFSLNILKPNLELSNYSFHKCCSHCSFQPVVCVVFFLVFDCNCLQMDTCQQQQCGSLSDIDHIHGQLIWCRFARNWSGPCPEMI